MRFGEIKLPKRLIQARREGNLAVFAGAGVSAGPPSSLPGFDELVRLVATNTPGIDPQDRKSKPFDRFLGELHRSGEGVKVHDIVKEKIGREDSEPTPLHDELLQLFDSPSEVRIVTTNFDRHFTTAACDHFQEEVPHYYAPALPLGSSFDGIVYLHGSVEQTSDQLVLTDEDFSRAYLTEGWARRFLQDLFAEYYVLFVGYSHGDAVIEYLARGIPPTNDKGRFAIDKEWSDTDSDQPTNWKYFGIEPIWYPKAEGANEYAELPKALKRWNQYAHQTTLEYGRQVKEIVEGHSPDELSPEAKDALLDRLRTASGARSFACSALDSAWLYWLDEEDVITSLFEPSDLSEAENILGEWISKIPLRRHSDQTLALVGPNVHNLNSTFWSQLVRSLWDVNDKNELTPEDVARWVQCLLKYPFGRTHNLDLLLSDGLRSPEDKEAALLLLDFLLEPEGGFDQGFAHLQSNSSQPSASHFISLRAEGYSLQRAWEGFFRPVLDECSHDLVSIATTKIRKLHRLYDSVGRVDPSGESPLSRSRSAIEPHEQDRHSTDDAAHVLVDLARDTIESLLQNSPVLAQHVIQKWAFSDITLLERLSLHASTEDQKTDADTKVSRLIQHNWIHSRPHLHETFRLLADNYRHTNAETREELLNHIWEEWPGKDDERRKAKARWVYRITHWLFEHSTNCAAAKKRLDRIGDEFDFSPYERPDLLLWVGDFEPVESEDRSEDLLRQPPIDQIDELIEILKGNGFATSEDHVNKSDVESAIAKEYRWGFNLMNELADRDAWNKEMWRPIWRGMRQTPLQDRDWEELFDFIQTHDMVIKSHADSLSMLLEQRCKPNEGDLPTQFLDQAANIADRLSEAVHDIPIRTDTDNRYVIRLLNHPGSAIATFFIYALIRLHNARELESMPAKYQQRLGLILKEESNAADAGQMVIGSQIGFLHYLDSEWVETELLPLFGWSDNRKGYNVWTGLLFRGLRIGPAVAQRLKSISANAFSRVSDQSLEFQRQFSGFVAQVAVSEAVDPIEDNWILQYLDQDDVDRCHWIGKMSQILRQLDTNRTESLWNDWLKKYWKLRLEGKPPLTAKETGKMIEWIPDLKPVIEEAVDLLTESPNPDSDPHDSMSHVLYRVSDTALGKTRPRAITQLLIFLLQSANSIRLNPDGYIEKILNDIADSAVSTPADFQELIERATELNYISADQAEKLVTVARDASA